MKVDSTNSVQNTLANAKDIHPNSLISKLMNNCPLSIITFDIMGNIIQLNKNLINKFANIQRKIKPLKTIYELLSHTNLSKSQIKNFLNGSEEKIEFTFSNNKFILQLFYKDESNIFATINTQETNSKFLNNLVYLKNVIEQSPNSIVITDYDGVIEYVNPKFIRITGYTNSEVIGKNANILKSGESSKEFYTELWTTLRSEKIWSGKFHNKKKNGELFWEYAKIIPIKTEDGIVTGYMSIKEDISEKIRLEEQLFQSQKMESIGNLAAGIAHEINTPLQYVGDNTSFLQDSFKVLVEFIDNIELNFSNNESKQIINKLKEEFDIDFLKDEIPTAIEQSTIGINNVSKLILSMKDFAHPGSKEKEFANINHGIRITGEISKNKWKYASELKFNLEETLPSVYCKPGELNQVFLNMIVNAVHAIEERKLKETSHHGTITISTKTISEEIEIIVEDNGNGIPEEYIKKIYDPFFTTKSMGKGTGQGLAISFDIIVNKHNGRIKVESSRGIGTKFIISLPINGSITNTKDQ